MAPPKDCTHTVYKCLPGSGPAEAAEEENFGPKIQQRDGVRKVEEPLVNLCQPKERGQGTRRGEERRRGMTPDFHGPPGAHRTPRDVRCSSDHWTLPPAEPIPGLAGR